MIRQYLLNYIILYAKDVLYKFLVLKQMYLHAIKYGRKCGMIFNNNNNTLATPILYVT